MLPKVLAVVQVYNPNYARGSDTPFWIMAEREVEVLSLNLNSGGMRVRYKDVSIDGTVKNTTCDIGIEWFDAKYKIVEKV